MDPTLSEHGLRDIDLCAEILRQLRPLSRQAAQYLEHQRLTEAGTPDAEIVRIGRVNPLAVEETAALSARIVEIAERVEAAAIPDWDTPQRIRERSERLLPDSGYITDIADRLAAAIRPALALSYPATTAVRLAGLVEQLRAVADAEAGGSRG